MSSEKTKNVVVRENSINSRGASDEESKKENCWAKVSRSLGNGRINNGRRWRMGPDPLFALAGHEMLQLVVEVLCLR